MQDINKKAIKEALKNEVNPLLIGLRNEIKGTNALLEKLQKEGAVNHHHINLKVNGKEMPEITVKDGYTPQFGIDYFTDDHIASFVKASTPKKGKDYFTAKEIKDFVKKATPKKNKDYFDGENGRTPVKGVDYFTKKEVKDFLKTITPVKGKDYFDGKKGEKGTDGINGKNGTEISAQEIRNKLESLKGKDRLKIKAIDGLEEILTVLSNLSSGNGAYPADSGASLSPTGVTPGSYTSANITVNAYGQITSASNGSGGGGGGTWGSITGTLSAQTDLQSALNAKLSTVSVDGITITGDGASTPLSATQQISLLNNGNTNNSQSILNLCQGSGMVITDYGGGVIQFDAVTSPAGNPGQIQFYDSVTGLTGGIPDSYSDLTGTYFNSGKLLITTDVTDRTKAGTFDAGLLDGFYTYNLPKGAGTLALTVNGVSADDSGNISISAGTPAGSNTELQYNNAGSFGGISGATTNGTSVTYTTGNLLVADVKASSSAGVQILGNSGTVTALFGAGGGANSTFYGGSKFDYATASTVPYFDGSKNLISSPNLLNDGLKVTIAQPVSTSGSPTGFLYTGGAHTTLAASTEAIDVDWALNRTVQFATGALTLQRAMYLRGTTYAFVGASTLSDAYTLVVDAPVQGTNATITRSAAIWANGRFKIGSGTTGLLFRDNTSSGLFAAIYSTNVTPSNTNHFWMYNGVTTIINATSAGNLQLQINGSAIFTVASGGTTYADAKNITFNATTGTKIGTATTEKLAFWNKTPIVQPANTVAIDTLLVNTGLRASGGNANFDTAIVNSLPMRLKGYTVAGLPAGTQGDMAFVTDALAPVWGSTVAGGGAVVVPVFYDGTNWIVD